MTNEKQSSTIQHDHKSSIFTHIITFMIQIPIFFMANLNTIMILVGIITTYYTVQKAYEYAPIAMEKTGEYAYHSDQYVRGILSDCQSWISSKVYGTAPPGASVMKIPSMSRINQTVANRYFRISEQDEKEAESRQTVIEKLNQMVQTRLDELHGISKDPRILGTIRPFMALYQPYAVKMNEMTSLGRQCRKMEKIRYSDSVSMLTNRENESPIGRASRIHASLPDLSKQYDDIASCYGRLENLYVGLVRDADVLQNATATTNANYDEIAKSIATGMSFKRMVLEYGLSWMVTYIPSAIFFGSIDDVKTVAVSSYGIIHRAMAHIYDKKMVRPKQLQEIKTIQGWMAMFGSIIMSHRQYLRRKQESIDSMKITLNDLITKVNRIYSIADVASPSFDIGIVFEGYIQTITDSLNLVHNQRKKMNRKCRILQRLMRIRQELELKKNAHEIIQSLDVDKIVQDENHRMNQFLSFELNKSDMSRHSFQSSASASSSTQVESSGNENPLQSISNSLGIPNDVITTDIIKNT